MFPRSKLADGSFPVELMAGVGGSGWGGGVGSGGMVSVDLIWKLSAYVKDYSNESG